MSYTMVHIYIAENVAKQIKRITDYPTYLLGAIAPDAVHARDNYDPSQKEKSHLFTDGLRWGKIREDTQVGAWTDSIRKYYSAHKDGPDYDFHLGYAVHLFSDVYSSRYFYAPLIKTMGGDIEKIKPQFLKENFGYNYYLYLKYSKDHDLHAILNAGKPITSEGGVTVEDIKKRVELLFKQEFAERDISDIDSYTICPHEAMSAMMEASTELVLKNLRELDKEL